MEAEPYFTLMGQLANCIQTLYPAGWPASAQAAVQCLGITSKWYGCPTKLSESDLKTLLAAIPHPSKFSWQEDTFKEVKVGPLSVSCIAHMAE